MTVLPLTHPRSVEPQQPSRSAAHTVFRVRAGGRYGFYNGPVTAKIPLPAFSLTARHPKTIVVVGRNDNRFTLAGEEAAYCANLSSLIIRGAITDDLKNFCRFLTGWSFPRIHLRQKPTRGLFQAFKSVLRCLVLVHDENRNEGALHCQTIPLKDRTRCL